MGKHRHSKDKMYITFWEQSHEWEGKKNADKTPLTQLPFYCCSLGLQPFENPVCTPDGIVFDLVNIIPFIKKYKQCPVTGKPLKVGDLIKLNFQKNEKGEYQDPMSFKTFTDHTHIVAVRTTGNVYQYDTVDELNKKAKYWKDLLTGEPFTFKDIITLQDPKNLERRTILNFDYIKNRLPFQPVSKNEDISEYINQNATAKKVAELWQVQENQEQLKRDEERKQRLENVEKVIKKQKNLEESVSVQEFIDFCIEHKVFVHERETTANEAISVTSSYNRTNAVGATQFRSLNAQEIRKKVYDEIKRKQTKAYVTIKTNIGDMSVMLHCNFAPKACENFLELSESKYYNGTKFHRLVPGFIVQGGDPTGTGGGGESVFGQEFEDEFHSKLHHDKVGVLSMANNKRDGNGSQFFITLGECQYLDNLHTIFGEVLQGLGVLNKMNDTGVTENEKPKRPLVLEQVIVHENPYRQIVDKYREEWRKKRALTTEKLAELNSDRWIQRDDNENEEGEGGAQGFKLPAPKKDDEEDDDNGNDAKNGAQKKQEGRDAAGSGQDGAQKKKKIIRAGLLSQILGDQPPAHYEKSDEKLRKFFNFDHF